MSGSLQPMDDVLVLIPGITGSMLTKNQKPIWDLSGGTIIKSIVSLGARVRELTLSPDVGDDDPKDGVEATGLMPSLHVIPRIWSPVTGYDGFTAWLKENFQLIEVDPRNPDKVIGNFLPFPHDWRLSNRLNAKRLQRVTEPVLKRWQKEGHPNAKLTILCHSMGGLIARYYLEVLGGAEKTRTLITLGTPYRGALRALDVLANGASFQLGPLKLDFTELARSFPAAYQLLPEYECVKTANGLESVVDANPFREAYMVMMAKDAASFHSEIAAAVGKRSDPPYATHPIVGVRQRTMITAELHNGNIVPVWGYPGTNDAQQRGDGTVPRLAARPKEWVPTKPGLVYPVEQHGTLHANKAMRDHIWGVLTETAVVSFKAPGAGFGVFVPEVNLASDPLAVVAELEGRADLALVATVLDEFGNQKKSVPLVYAGAGQYKAEVAGLEPGVYAVRVVDTAGDPQDKLPTVTAQTLIWEATPVAGG